MGELTIQKITYKLPSITYDLSELKTEVDKLNKKYEGFVLTEKDISSMKKEMAMLNKLSKNINDQKIAIAKEIKQPVTKFESEIKEIVNTINETYRRLKDQTDYFAEQEKEQKKQEILSLEEWTPEYMFFNEEWLKQNYSIKKIKEEIESYKIAFQNQCLLIETTCKSLGLESEKYYQMLVEHRDITEIVDLINNDKEVKERYANEESKTTTAPSIQIEDVEDTDIYAYTLKISGTRTQLQLLKQYLEENKLKYEKV